MSIIRSFKPIADKQARILILGSMPGVRSLEENQYYAHPRNAFWKIMAELYGFDPSLSYECRTKQLKVSGIALWDVLFSCARIGSLDSAIQSGSRVPNDFESFFKDHPSIKTVAFNGAEAEKTFKTHVQPDLCLDDLRYVRLPSSSPAYTLTLEKKIAVWRDALGV